MLNVSTPDPLWALIRRMKPTRPFRDFGRVFAMFLSLALAATLPTSCGSKGGGGPVGNVVIHDENNYSSTSQLTIPILQTAPMADLTFTWDGIMNDLLCHPVGSIDNVAFLQIKNMTQMDVEQKLADGKLSQNQVADYAEKHIMKAADGSTPTSVLFSTFDNYDPSSFTLVTDYVPSTTAQYLTLFTHGTTLGVGAQSMIFIQPTAGVATTTVAAPNPCPDGTANGTNEFLHFTPTLSAMTVSIPLNGPWKIDWSEITTDNFGNTLDFSQTTLDKVEVGFFQGKTSADIQADFLNVEQDATALYTYAVPTGQKYVDLTSTPTSGVAFPGFAQTDGTWAAAVLCSACSVPAPIVFTILVPQ